jgi:hypothetical protein
MADSPAILTSSTPAAPPIAPASTPAAAQPPARSEVPPKPVTPGSKAWAEMSPDQRAAHQRTVADTGRTSASVHTRTPDGRPLIDGKLPDGTIPQSDGASAPADSAAPPIEGEKVKVGEFETTEAEIRSMLAEKAERDLARTQIPADAKGYELKLPEGAKLPGDMQIKFGTDPESLAMIDAAKAWAHKKGLSQAEFSDLLAIQAHTVAAKELKIATYAKAEVDKLGANGPQRIDALTVWIRGLVGDTDAKPIISTMATAAHVRFYEQLFNKVTGTGSFRQTGRDVEPRGVDEATYNSWSYGEKKAYAERASSPGNRR